MRALFRSREVTISIKILLVVLPLACVASQYRTESETRLKQLSNNPYVAVIVPSRSQTSWQIPEDSSLITTLLPSLHASTTETERNTFDIEVFVIFDRMDDMFWERSDIRSQAQISSHFPAHFVSVEKTNRIPHNEGCRLAYEMGADYIVRVNDDTEFKGFGWLTLGINALEKFQPPRLGVVGPTCLEGNTHILTHDMVHRTHLDIFEEYYPVEFDNWWLDDWITLVYGAHHTRKLEEWLVVHHTERYGRRYNESVEQKLLLPELLSRSRQQIIDFLTVDKHAGRRLPVLENHRVEFFPDVIHQTSRVNKTLTRLSF